MPDVHWERHGVGNRPRNIPGTGSIFRAVISGKLRNKQLFFRDFCNVRRIIMRLHRGEGK